MLMDNLLPSREGRNIHKFEYISKSIYCSKIQILQNPN